MSAENIFNSIPPEVIEIIKRNTEGQKSLERAGEAYYQVTSNQEKANEHLRKALICLGTGCASSVIVPMAGLVFLPEFVRQVILERRNGKTLTSSEIEYNEALDHLLSLIPEEELDKLDH
jgi:hypothetical protein